MAKHQTCHQYHTLDDLATLVPDTLVPAKRDPDIYTPIERLVSLVQAG